MEPKNSEFQVRRATIDDLAKVYALCRPYYDKSIHAQYREISPASTLHIFSVALEHPQIHSFLVEKEELPWAFASISYEISFAGGYDACLKFFYTDPLARATEVSRMLRDAVVADFYDMTDYGNIMVAEAQAEIKDDNGVNGQLFNNLFLKSGFTEMSAPAVYLVNMKGKDDGRIQQS